MRTEVRNAIRLIGSGDVANVEMALRSLAPVMNDLLNKSRLHQNPEVEAIIRSIMKKAFRKYFRPFGIEVRNVEGTYSVLQLRTRIGCLQYRTANESLLHVLVSNPESWRSFVAQEIGAVLKDVMNDPMNNNDWKP